MLFTECECGEGIIVSWESGDEPGYSRFDCPKCGKICMVELKSLCGETIILDNEEKFEEFLIEKSLKKPDKK